MARERRIGLIVAFIFIVLFALVLSELAGTSQWAGRRSNGIVKQADREGWLPIVKTVRPPGGKPVEPISIFQPARAGRTARIKPIILAAELPVVESDAAALGAADPSGVVRPGVRGRRRQAGRTYTVQPNDSLRKIARKVYGPEHEERYRQIFQANRDVLDDESMVIVGQELIIPPLRDLQPRPDGCRVEQDAGEAAAGWREMDLGQLREHFGGPAATGRRQAAGQRVYVVREGDNLTKIARRLLKDGSSRAVMRIYEANRDKLSSPDVLVVGMKLRIPN